VSRSVFELSGPLRSQVHRAVHDVFIDLLSVILINKTDGLIDRVKDVFLGVLLELFIVVFEGLLHHKMQD
jgi:hypothetical protein